MALPRSYISPEQYVRMEEQSQQKHEYFNGEIFLMAGGTPRHNLISTNIASELRSRLRGLGCRPYNSDQRIYIPANGLYTYPDVSVICGEEEYVPGDTTTLVNPLLIVEVLSPSTAKKDRFDKFELYQGLESFKGYVLVEQARPHIQYWQRGDDGQWLGKMVLGLEATLKVDVLGIDLPLRFIYEDVAFDPPYVEGVTPLVQ